MSELYIFARFLLAHPLDVIRSSLIG